MSADPSGAARAATRRAGPPVVVVGAGIAGLMAALALQRHGFAVRVLERDPPPPAGIAPADSMQWLRKGVPQSLHPHFLMGRLRALIRERYPDLLQRLLDGGVGESTLAHYLHPLAARDYRQVPQDERLGTLNARRTTLEMLLREHAAQQDGIELRSAARVLGVITDGASPPRVTGVEYEDGAAPVTLAADVVVDASGRFGKLAESLPVELPVEQRDSGLWYFTRHYRRRPACPFPMHAGTPGAQFADFIVGALPADNGAFTVTFQVYREDRDIARALRDPAHFQAMCMRVAKIRPWVDPAHAEPTSEVFGFGQMDSFWRHLVVDGQPRVLGYFVVGDSGVRSNPKFGRGCTWSSVSAHALADVLAGQADPVARVHAFEAWLAQAWRADWETMQQIDASTTAGFEIAAGRRAGTLAERLAMRLETWVNDACVLDAALFRQIWTGYHGFQDMKAWMRQPAMWLRLLRALLRRPGIRPVLAALAERPTRAELAGAGGATIDTVRRDAAPAEAGD